MAVPFRRKSRRRVRLGRSGSNWQFLQKFSGQPLHRCANCRGIKLLHRVCPHCSFYRQLNFSGKPTKENSQGDR